MPTDHTAAIQGWLVLRFSSSMIRAGGVLDVIEEALRSHIRIERVEP